MMMMSHAVKVLEKKGAIQLCAFHSEHECSNYLTGKRCHARVQSDSVCAPCEFHFNFHTSSGRGQAVHFQSLNYIINPFKVDALYELTFSVY